MPRPSPAPYQPRLGNLDVFRGLAALAVCLFHFASSRFLPDGAIAGLIMHGYLGFDVFFVISGFVIPLALHQSGYRMAGYGTFLWRRLIRLYPAFLISAVLAVGLWYTSSLHPAFQGGPPRITGIQLVGNLTLTADLLRTPWVNPVFWTLAIELQYYLLIGLVFPWMLAGSRIQRWAFMASWLVAPLLVPWPATVLAYAALFAMGIFSFLRSRGFITTPEYVFGLIACTAVHGWRFDGLSSGAGLATALAISLLPPITARPLLFLGTISYSLYLIHVPFGGKLIHLVQRVTDNAVFRGGLLVLTTLATLAAAWVFYRLIERPFHDLSRSWYARKPSPPLAK